MKKIITQKKISFLIVMFCAVVLAACGGGGGGGGSTGGGDTMAPTVPTGFTATTIAADQIDLSWNTSFDDTGVTGYKIYRGNSLLTTVTRTSHSDTGLTINTQYCYTVSAIDDAGNESSQCTSACATTEDTWTVRARGSAMTVKAVAYSGSLYVAGGDAAEVLVSTDAVSWTRKSAIKLNDIIWDGTRFIGLDPWDDIHVSSDGTGWSRIGGAAMGTNLNALASSGSVLVAVGDEGTIMTSSDLSTWSTYTTGNAGDWFVDVIWGGGQFVAVGGSGIIFTSPDGITWTERYNTWGPNFRSIAWSGSRYVAANNTWNSPGSFTSTDGITWTQNTDQLLDSVTWSDSLNLFVGIQYYESYTSPDGLTWTQAGHIPALTWLPESLIWDGTQFLVTSEPGYIAASPDAQEWSIRSIGPDLKSVIWSGSEFIAVGSNGIIMRSPDGISWTYEDLRWTGAVGTLNNGEFLLDVVMGSGNDMVVGAQDFIFYTPNGSNPWSYYSLGATTSAYGVAWSGSEFVCVSSGGTSWVSADGTTWTWHDTGTNAVLYDVIWDGSRYVAVGSGTVRTSSDGMTWTAQTAGVTGDLRSVAESGTQYVAVGTSGTVLSSPDAVTWTSRSSGTSSILYNVTWTGSAFIAVGNGNTIVTSLDGVTWTDDSPAQSYGTFYGVASNGTRHVTVANDGTILTLH